jgi:hypothetical protein
MTEVEAISIDEDEIMDETQLLEYAELVEALGTRAVSAFVEEYSPLCPVTYPCNSEAHSIDNAGKVNR